MENPKRVFINALSARQGGGQTYLINLLRESIPPQVEVLLIAPNGFKIDSTQIRQLSAPRWLERPLARVLWEKFILPRHLKKHKIDILFCPGGSIATTPPDHCKTVTMHRNMLPFSREVQKLYPWGYQKIRLWITRFTFGRSMATADLTIFISEYGRKVVKDSVHPWYAKDVTIPHGVSAQSRKLLRTVPEKQNKKFILYVSSFDYYKNQKELIRAYKKLLENRSTTEDLLLIGPINRDYLALVEREIEISGLKDRVHIKNTIPYQELLKFYQQASLFVYPSVCENCPNILLEAMSAGVPIISSDVPPMPEFGDNAVAYFNPYDPEDMAKKMAQVLDDPTLQKKLAEQALKRAELYDWNITAQKTWDAILDL